MVKKVSFIIIKKKSLIYSLIGAAICLAAIFVCVNVFSSEFQTVIGQNDSGYVILAMNDSGMHCYQKDYSSFLILPPGNTLKVQVIQNNFETAQLINSGIEVSYEIIDNTTSADKTNFWNYAKDYGYDVAPNIGITGNSLKGVFKLSSDGKYYEAAAIPITPYNDGSTELNPLQLARIKVVDNNTGKLLVMAENIVVPVSDEMQCSACHGTTDTDLNILKVHDKLSETSLVKDLNDGKRYRCGDCHKDNALGLPGNADVLPFSQAMHGFHADKMGESSITPVCYSCHPGPVTQCYRGRMLQDGITCDNEKCHGNIANLASTQASGRQAWLQEPDCGACHGTAYAANQNMLYRNSYLLNAPGDEMNDILLCESCHNSPHAEWKSSQDKDNLLPISLQGYANYLKKCSVCHEGQGKVHIRPDN